MTPYHYTVGSVVLINNLAEKVRHWAGPYTIVWLDSHRCKLINHISGKQVNSLVHINWIKPYFYRDEIPDDPNKFDIEDLVTVGDKVTVNSHAPNFLDL